MVNMLKLRQSQSNFLSVSSPYHRWNIKTRTMKMSFCVGRKQETSTVSKQWLVLWKMCSSKKPNKTNQFQFASQFFRLYIIRKKSTKDPYIDHDPKNPLLPLTNMASSCPVAAAFRALWELIFVVSQGHFTDGNDHRNLLTPRGKMSRWVGGEC